MEWDKEESIRLAIKRLKEIRETYENREEAILDGGMEVGDLLNKLGCRKVTREWEKILFPKQ